MTVHHVVNLPETEQAIDLTFLATSDLHLHVLGFDYFQNTRSGSFGFARIASAIAAIRAEVDNCLVLDNGDLFQGSPMGDFLAETGWDRDAHHPLVAAMNHAGYDAATIGNHDFSHGIDHLREALQGASHPVICTNLNGGDLPVLPHLILQRRMSDKVGGQHDLRVGILGFLPPQTVEWEPDLQGRIRIDDIISSARRGIAALEREGVDLIVALCHSGIGSAEVASGMENAATALATLPGIDLIVAGHTHRLFPSTEHPGGPAIDTTRGTLAGKPCVMPGFWGSHLGRIDLRLRPGGGGRRWRVETFRATLEPAKQHVEDPAIRRLTLAAHRGTLRHLRRPIGTSATGMHSFFTLIGQDAGLALVRTAQRRHAEDLLRGGNWQGIPVLSAAAPFRAGGRGGPGHYTDIPAGPLSLRSLSDLYLFPNRLCAIHVNGAALANWLEISASIYRQITPGLANQLLIDPDFPSYNFDLIDDLTWQIDLTAPPRHAPDGRLTNPQCHRIRDLRHRGRQIAPDDPFILVTNSYRLSANGVFGSVTRDRPVVLESGTRSRDALHDYVASQARVTPEPDLGWRFRPVAGASVLFQTSPRAASRLDTMPYLVENLGLRPDGFLELRLTF